MATHVGLHELVRVKNKLTVYYSQLLFESAVGYALFQFV